MARPRGDLAVFNRSLRRRVDRAIDNSTALSLGAFTAKSTNSSACWLKVVFVVKIFLHISE
jgi:hypothetical protein